MHRSFSPVATAEQLLVAAQAASGLPWWATIVGVSVAMRLAVTFPIARYVQAVSARGLLAADEVRQREPELTRQVAVAAKARGASFEAFAAELAARKASLARATYAGARAYLPLQVGDRAVPFPAPLLLPWVQLPLFVTMSLALRRLTGAPVLWLDSRDAAVASLATGGFGPWLDLTAADPTRVVVGTAIMLLSLANVEFFELTATRERSGFARALSNGLRVLAVASLPLAAAVPSAVALYWLTSAGYGLAQSTLLYQRPVRRLLGIPATRLESVEIVFWKRLRQARARQHERARPGPTSNEP